MTSSLPPQAPGLAPDWTALTLLSARGAPRSRRTRRAPHGRAVPRRRRSPPPAVPLASEVILLAVLEHRTAIVPAPGAASPVLRVLCLPVRVESVVAPALPPGDVPYGSDHEDQRDAAPDGDADDGGVGEPRG